MNEKFCISKKIRSKYDNQYSNVSEWRSLGAVGKANSIVKLCKKYPHRKILEIGAGDGAILKRLSDLSFGESTYALEISQSALKVIQKRNIKSLAECRIFDGYNIPYSDQEFDLVILSHVLEHVEYPRKIIYEASRVGKIVFIEVPLELTVRLPSDYIEDKTGHINFYSLKTIRRLLQTCDLKILDQRLYNNSYGIYKYQFGKIKGMVKFIIKELLLKLSPRIATSIFTYNCSIICAKKD